MYQNIDPGQVVVDFVLLHSARQASGGDQCDLGPLEDRYQDALQTMRELAREDLSLCLLLLADLACHYASTLEDKAGFGVVDAVTSDWPGRGWSVRFARAGSIPSPFRVARRASTGPSGRGYLPGDEPPF
ncbi:hypothetical protein JOD57_000019 [Geodermatophilus bullaregiensis]|uniref:hypothetical protein n=1 Tax=Geodermatophilus bullaregiensis TaxID=1564160 RepID=UPI001959353A|nr:hypothetical protein [Geodermatophilus bullaregiensis]MBM7804182.1 hypothetical protein [Geodermatophilus bullaregiensis]